MITIITKLFQVGILDTNKVLIKETVSPLHRDTRLERRMKK
jgi:hypothetical protein